MTTTVAERRLVSSSEAARLLGRHPNTLSRAIGRGGLSQVIDPTDRRRRLVDLDELQALMAKRRTREVGAVSA